MLSAMVVWIHSPTSTGVIEGSEDSLGCEARYVSANAYRKLSHRRQHVFADKRDELYELFCNYLALKQIRGEFDSADRWGFFSLALSRGFALTIGKHPPNFKELRNPRYPRIENWLLVRWPSSLQIAFLYQRSALDMSTKRKTTW